MKQTGVITREMIAETEKDFLELYKNFRPEPAILADINMAKAIKKVMDYRRLMTQNRGNKHERPYSLKMYHEMKAMIPKFKFYYQNKETKS